LMDSSRRLSRALNVIVDVGQMRRWLVVEIASLDDRATCFFESKPSSPLFSVRM